MKSWMLVKLKVFGFILVKTLVLNGLTSSINWHNNIQSVPYEIDYSFLVFVILFSEMIYIKQNTVIKLKSVEQQVAETTS